MSKESELTKFEKFDNFTLKSYFLNLADFLLCFKFESAIKRKLIIKKNNNNPDNFQQQRENRSTFYTHYLTVTRYRKDNISSPLFQRGDQMFSRTRQNVSDGVVRCEMEIFRQDLFRYQLRHDQLTNFFWVARLLFA